MPEPTSLIDCIEDMNSILEAMERVKGRIRRRRPQLYERWKADGFIVDADVISMYPSLHDISQEVMEERDTNDMVEEA